MAEFMQGAVAQTKRRRKATDETPTPSAEHERVSSSTTRTDDELAALAAQFTHTHVPRAQWPAEVLEWQQRRQREKKRSTRAALAEDDRLRREIEQAQRREQLDNDDDDDDDDEGEDVQQREASRQKARPKRARDNADCDVARLSCRVDDDELVAARAAPHEPRRRR